MTKLKRPEEYAAECGVFKESKIAPMNLNLYRDAHVKSQRDIVKAIQLAQHDAYNQALDYAAKSADIFIDYESGEKFTTDSWDLQRDNDGSLFSVNVSCESILKLKI